MTLSDAGERLVSEGTPQKSWPRGNLFRRLLEICSNLTIGDYQQATRQTPFVLLLQALDRNPHVDPQRIQRISSALAGDGEERGWWRDCELYLPLFGLIDMAPDAESADRWLVKAEVILGLSPLQELCAAAPGIHRLWRSHGGVFEASEGTVRRLEHLRACRSPNSDAIIYPPSRELFSDLSRFTPGWNEPAAGCSAEALRRIDEALALLRQQCPDLVADFEQAISTIVLVPPLSSDPGGRPLQWSYNLRLRYFGAVFIDVLSVGPLAIVEGLIHEYYHQRLWQWFQIERPSGLPQKRVRVRSPITGIMREARVMIHALLIYIAACELHRRALSASFLSKEDSEWAEWRLACLVNGIPPLYDTLCSVVKPGTAVRAAIDGIFAEFEQQAETVCSPA